MGRRKEKIPSVNGRDIYGTSRTLYIIEAALEYFISILMGGAYLARLTDYVGMSDGMTAVLSAFVSLGCTAQLVALLLINRRSVKRLVTLGEIFNQLLFTVVYLTPFLPIPSGARPWVMVVGLMLGHFIANAVKAPKTNWFMDLVDHDHRGVFTANKEIVSLISGMVFTFGIGKLIDLFEANGNTEGVFVASAVAIFVFCIGHTLTLVFSKEKTVEESTVRREKISARELFSNRTYFKVIGVSVLWAMINYSTTPFFGTYQNKELAFTAVFIAIISAIASVSRAVFSRPLGRFGDRHSFATLLMICFGIQAAALVFSMFAVPANGKIFYTAYAVLHAVSMAGINSGDFNLVYDYIPHRLRTVGIAIKCSVAGIVGFLTTLAVRPLVEYIQASGNRFLGMNVYAQQVVSALGLALTLLTILYLCTVVRRLRRNQDGDTPQA